MKVKTSITLSEDLVHRIDGLSGSRRTRSEFIEEAVRDYLERLVKRKRDEEDLAILDSRADKLNKEAEDVLSYQADL